VKQFDDDLLNPELIRNPHPYYAMLREERPVHWNSRWRGWIVSRYEDVSASLHDARMLADTVTPYFSAMNAGERERFSLTENILTSWVVFQDGSRHAQLRRLFSRAFNPRAVQKMRDVVQHHVSALLDRWQGRKQLDLVGEFASPLPANVIATMIGAPRADLDKFHHWADVMTELVHGGVGADDRLKRAQDALSEFRDYLLVLYKQRVTAPQEDMMSWLIQVQRAEASLTENDVIYSCMLLLAAGHETTQSLMTNSIVSLLESPDQAQQLRERPELMKTAIEECLRFNGPMKGTMRAAAEDLQIRDAEVKKGDRILLLMASANRDPERFGSPEQFDIQRDPNPHLSFGHGLHFCLGFPLARLEMEIALRDMFNRYPSIRLEESVQYAPRILSRSIQGQVRIGMP
jgi:cytochrome P450